MNLHLAEIARNIAPGAHAVVLLDQAGWHMTDKLNVPPNVTIMPLPAKCPELNPQENVWQFLRDNRLSNRKRDRTTADQLRGATFFCIFCLIRMDTDRCGRLFAIGSRG